MWQHQSFSKRVCGHKCESDFFSIFTSGVIPDIRHAIQTKIYSIFVCSKRNKYIKSCINQLKYDFSFQKKKKIGDPCKEMKKKHREKYGYLHYFFQKSWSLNNAKIFISKNRTVVHSTPHYLNKETNNLTVLYVCELCSHFVMCRILSKLILLAYIGSNLKRH